MRLLLIHEFEIEETYSIRQTYTDTLAPLHSSFHFLPTFALLFIWKLVEDNQTNETTFFLGELE